MNSPSPPRRSPLRTDTAQSKIKTPVNRLCTGRQKGLDDETKNSDFPVEGEVFGGHETDLRPPTQPTSGFGNDKKVVPTEASNHGSWGVAAPILLPPSYFRIPIKGLFSLLSYGILTMR